MDPLARIATMLKDPDLPEEDRQYALETLNALLEEEKMKHPEKYAESLALLQEFENLIQRAVR